MSILKQDSTNRGYAISGVTSTLYGIYFANLAAYVSGRLVGDWVYPLQYDSFKEFAEAIREATKDGTEYADEIAVHDYDNFPDMGEYPDHESIYNLAHAIDESYLDDEILIKYFNDFYGYDLEELAENIQDIESAFIGEFGGFRDFADETADETIKCIVNKDAQQFVFNNFDYEGYARDLEYSYNVITLDNYKVAIFDQQ
jgi:antirestriction protein